MTDEKRSYHLSVEAVAAALATDLNGGLSPAEIAHRRAQFGPNQLEGKKGPSPLTIFLEQFHDFIIWVLIGAALVSGFLQEWVDAIAIIAIVILNAIMGFIQEYRAEKALAELKKLASPVSKVIRAGQHLSVPSAELVVGDLIELEAGDYVPADSRLVYVTANFTTHEASLTGESTPVAKTSYALEEKEIPLADRANMAYMGTSVAAGKARAIVVDTGMRTELGKIANMIQGIEEETTPLQKKLEAFGKWIVWICFILVGIVFAAGIMRGGTLMEMFLTAVSLAVAAIPEGLPAVVTIALALGVQRMVKRHALIRKLPSVETLGCATVICSDKTGTLTKNEMTVQALYAAGTNYAVTGVGYAPTGGFLRGAAMIDAATVPALLTLVRYGILCNGASLIERAGSYAIVGDPTEGALVTVAAKAGLSKEAEEKAYPFLGEIPFDSERKKMTMIRRGPDGTIYAIVKGAADVLINDCIAVTDASATHPITDAERDQILAATTAFADQALRVLAVAYKVLDRIPTAYDATALESGLTFVGLAAMIDPPRDEVKKAVREAMGAGMRTVMITGDHKSTAIAIARELGFFTSGARAITGDELDRMSDAELDRAVAHIVVYARVSPEHKLRIVRAWRKRGDIVAMTGDGVNDAPAVKEADIGVAMGITGTDVTKEVSDMVVTDDNFASIVAAVREGRGIYENIKKFIHYLLSCNAGEILVMFTASLAGLPVPLLPIHILWVNLVTDGLPAIALGMDPTTADSMRQPPRPPNEPVVTATQARLMLMQGAFIAACSLAAFMLVLFVEQEGMARARTAAFIVLACSQLFHAFNCRSQTTSLFTLGIFTNTKLIAAASISFLLQMAVVYIPALQSVFKTAPLGILDWVIVIVISSFPLWAMEIVKGIRNFRRQTVVA